MKIEGELKDGLDLALNEACLLAFEYDNVLNKVTVIFETVTINTEDNKVVFHFLGVSRCSARLLMGRWNDENADVLKMTPDQLSAQLEDYNGDSMYGWEFINIEDSKEKFEEWKEISFDIIISQESESTNCIDLFSEQFIGSPKTLDLRICFEEIQIETLLGLPISIQEFIDRGAEGWNAIYSGNEQVTSKYGIVSAENFTKQKITPVHSTIWTRLRNWFTK